MHKISASVSKRSVRSAQILLFLFLLNSAHSEPILRNSLKADTVAKKRSGIIFIPAIFYTPETKLAGGASMMYYFRSSESSEISRPSTISPTFIYTQRKQIISLLFADLYWQQETYHFTGGFSYFNFPDKFYGIGASTPESLEEDFTPRTISFLANMQKKIQRALYIGILYEFANSKIIEVEEDGLLAGVDILGSEGGTVSGAGFYTNWDTRNTIFTPATGSYHQFSATFFKRAFGSDYDFNRYNLDLRTYFPVRASHVLAFQAYFNFISGDAPFQMLSKIGGQYLMRGYYDGRYRDKNLVVMQTEYRLPIWRRFGLVGFAGLGEVASKINHFEIDKLKYSIGWGVRYLFSRNEGLNIRMDFGYGENSSGFYITLGEAF